MSNSIKIGEWSFSPREAALSRGDERRRLENRAAETLEHLCRKNGEIVSHAELVEAVWQGRSLSPNSVAVVIADLRRALEDDARTPKYIETVPKRGYRMAASISVTSAGAL
jgi:DNA-binding winged helix-turn-helix (wHTH) protein